ncbi:sigma-70 family RNA polymerase sigma factor [Micromonospora sp. D93]|uniref:sigma-70 family RNA polymerase sigma factor n=1 Tax=Micromonospora sp. D93 TaxID=2824886 RepID=UPI0027DDCFDC|nr:sigma-70 family RNA polymerase sigma factor [Micromonospora sp. D93]
MDITLVNARSDLVERVRVVPSVTTDEHAERFVLLRPLLFTIVYEILGSATESDDVLQDSYLRWSQVDLATVRDTRSYLARLVTRQALNAMRASARRREDYVGPWLPEPLLLDENDPSADVVLAESVSMAMLVLLETLTPDERAVFVLREVFGFDYDEIAAAVGKSVPTVHQVAHRAREHVQARRRRFQPLDARKAARGAAKARHLAARSAVSAAHMRGEDLGVFTHGRVETLNPRDSEPAAAWPELLGYLKDFYGDDFFDWDNDVVYYRLHPHWMTVFAPDTAKLTAARCERVNKG